MWRRSLLAMLLLVGAAGCGDRPATDPRATVVATTPQVADLVRSIAGPELRVHQIVEVGDDPHEVEPSPADQEAVRGARAIFRNGVGLEPWLDRTLASAGSRAPVVDTSAGVTVRRGAGGEPDPHIWHDPRNAQQMVRNIEAGLVDAFPDLSEGVRGRAATFVRDLRALDVEVEAMVQRIPPAQRKLVTNHDALGYFADRYGFTVVGSVIPTFDSQAELSSQQLAELIARVRSEGVRAIFADSSLPPDTAAAVARDTGVRIVAGEDSLYADSMGPAGSPGATYVSMVRHNAEVIVANLA